MDFNLGSVQTDQDLVVGLVGAVGTDLELLIGAVKDSLQRVNYASEEIHLSHSLHELIGYGDLPASGPYDIYLIRHMDAGNEVRSKVGQGDALALLAIGGIREQRAKAREANASLGRKAYVLRSLKHPSEVGTLRRIYGPNFVLLSAYAPSDSRRTFLTRRIADSRGELQSDRHRSVAEDLIQRDAAEIDRKLGQDVRRTFPLADVFINTADPKGLRSAVERFVELLFGNPFLTPWRNEYGMFHAQAASLRSASLARQVGAVIATNDGDIVAIGTNEVPKATGGLYWADDAKDDRNFVRGYDVSDQFRKNVLTDVLGRLHRENWLSVDKEESDIESLVELVLGGEPSPLTGSYIMNSIEFVREVHAEMAAIVDAARRGASVRNCTLYTTTFPCHDCAKHIVAAGIDKVVYIEPYPKSLALELHGDSIAVERQGSGQVSFEPFVGVAPRRYMDLFSPPGERKGKGGRVVEWDRSSALPRTGEEAATQWARSIVEDGEFTRFKRKMVACGLLPPSLEKDEEVGRA